MKVQLISELKRRNVFRMAVLYVISAWLVMQVAEVIIGLAGLPDWSGKLVLAVLAIGFPIALIFSWFFEITPEGLALEKDVPEGQSITRATGRRMDFVVISVLAAGLILFAGDKWWPRGPPDFSIAVLAFDNLSGDPGEEYLSDGISDEILNVLAQIRPLKVIAKQSSFSFKGRNVDIATIARQLNVGWILEGSVRRHGDRIRVTAQLIDTRDSTHAWSRTYDRDMSATDLFYVQSEIARAVTRELRATLTDADEKRLDKRPTDNTEAYAAYLLGRQRLTDRKVKELGEAAEQFARAIELDPDFAGAYSGLADACYLYEGYSGGHVHDACPIRRSAGPPEDYAQSLIPLVRKALELDEGLGEAWITLGELLSRQDIGAPETMPLLAEAHEAFKRGLELNPSFSQGYHWYALTLLYVYHYENPPHGWFAAWKQRKWQSVIERGLEVDPLSVMLHYMMAGYPLWAQEKEEAIRHARRIIEIAPDSPRGYERLGELSWAPLGRIDEAIRWESKSAEIDPSHPTYPRVIGQAYATLGDVEMALAWFDRTMQIVSPQAKDLNQEVLIAEALAWLGSQDESSASKAKEILKKGDAYDEFRFEIEASFVLDADQAAALLEKYTDGDPDCVAEDIDDEILKNCPAWVDRLYQVLGDHERVQRRTSVRLEWDRLWYENFPSAYWSLRFLKDLAIVGRQEQALGVLEELIRAGWRGNYYHWVDSSLRFLLYHDATLDAIRDHPRFQALVAEVEADLAQQLENVREMERKGELPTLKEFASAAR